jgi:hypothetical protein
MFRALWDIATDPGIDAKERLILWEVGPYQSISEAIANGRIPQNNARVCL